MGEPDTDRHCEKNRAAVGVLARRRSASLFLLGGQGDGVTGNLLERLELLFMALHLRQWSQLALGDEPRWGAGCPWPKPDPNRNRLRILEPLETGSTNVPAYLSVTCLLEEPTDDISSPIQSWLQLLCPR